MLSNLPKIFILITVILMDILGGSEVDLFVPSFPELQKVFNLTPLLTENLLSLNFLGYATGIFFVGCLADYYGRRLIILIGTPVFIIGSLFCTFAKSYEFLLLGRLLQGIGVSAPATLCFLIIADLYSVKQQQVYISVLNAVVNIAVAIAPIIGSFIALYFHWQGNFIALLILGILVLIMTIIFIPSTELPRSAGKISLGNYITILKSKTLMTAITCLVAMFSHWWFFIGISPLLYIENLGVPLNHFGFYQGSLAFVFAFGCLVSSFIIDKFDQKLLIIISYKLCIIGLLLTILITYYDCKNPILITLSLIPYYVGTVIPFTIMYPLCINYISEAKSKVSATIVIFRLIFVGISLECAGYFYNGSFQNIGIILIFINILSIITLNLCIKNNNFMKFEKLEN